MSIWVPSLPHPPSDPDLAGFLLFSCFLLGFSPMDDTPDPEDLGPKYPFSERRLRRAISCKAYSEVGRGSLISGMLPDRFICSFSSSLDSLHAN